MSPPQVNIFNFFNHFSRFFNLRLVRGLYRSGGRNLSPSEQVQAEVMKTEGVFFRKTYEAMRAAKVDESSDGHFHDLSTIFADETAPVYFDFCHIGEEGNHAVASHMIDPVLEALNSR